MKNYTRLSEGLKLYRDVMRTFVGTTIRKTFPQGDWFADRVLPNVTPQQSDNLQRDLGLSQVETASALAHHFLDGAAEVDIDDIKAGLDQPHRPGRKLFRLGTHQLATDRVFFLGVPEEVPGPLTIAHLHEELVEHHLAERVGRPQALGNHPHRPVTVP